MFMVLMSLVVMMSVFVMLVSNVVFWWGVFLVMTLFFLLLNKGVKSYSSIFNYFVFQESLGLLFLLLFWGYFPMIILMLKIGVAPFHFWVFKVIGGVYGLNLVWFLTVHKLPFLLVFLQLYLLNLVFFMFVGLLVCMVQMFVLKSFKNLLVVSSVESFSWITISLVVSFFSVFFLFFYYLFLMMFLLYKFNIVGDLSESSWELVLVFLNLPFSFGFFIKIFMLMEVLKSFGIYLVILLFLMFLSVLSLSFWLVFLGTNGFFFGKYNESFFLFYLPLMVVVVL